MTTDEWTRKGSNEDKKRRNAPVRNTSYDAVGNTSIDVVRNASGNAPMLFYNILSMLMWMVNGKNQII